MPATIIQFRSPELRVACPEPTRFPSGLRTHDSGLLVQRTPAWRAARCGHITASRMADVVTTLKSGKESAARKHYREELAAERLTGEPTPPGYVSREMQWGVDQEPFARAAYEMLYNDLVDTAGFVIHPEIPFFGCSPDGLCGTHGMIQIKCPNTSTHLSWMRAGVIPLEHRPQMLAEMACTGRQWNDFVSFDPRLPPPLQLFVRSLALDHEDQPLIAALEAEVVRFDAEIEEMVGELSAVSSQPSA